MNFYNTSPSPQGHYSSAVEHNGMIFISGQLSIDPLTGKVPEGGIEVETCQALKGVDEALKVAGLGRNDVIKCTVFTSDVAYWGEINRVYADFFGSHKPARSVVPVSALHHGCLVEIEAIAVRR